MPSFDGPIIPITNQLTPAAQQAQELERAKSNYAIQKTAADDYEQQLAAMTTEREVLSNSREALVETVKELRQQLAASQARCVSLETALFQSEELLKTALAVARGLGKSEDWLTMASGIVRSENVELKQRLAASETTVQEVGRLRERLRLIETGGSCGSAGPPAEFRKLE